MAEHLSHLDVGDEPGRAPVDGAGLEQLGFAREAGEAVDAQRLGDAGHDEEQADARALHEILHAVEAPVAGEFGHEQACIRLHANETRRPALRARSRTIRPRPSSP